MKSVLSSLVASLALLLASPGNASASLPEPTPLDTLVSVSLCNRCVGTRLPGKVVPHQETRWGIISDLPESFATRGVLYSTRDTVPYNGGPENLRKQRKAAGFQTIDDGFDLFMFHVSKVTTMTARLVVYVRNQGDEPVTLAPHQVIKSEGLIGAVHEFESSLGKRVLARQWDVATLSSDGKYPEVTFGEPPEGSALAEVAITIPPREGRVIAYSKIFGQPAKESADSNPNQNCFGYVRARKTSTGPANLQVDVVAIPPVPRAQILAETEALLPIGAMTTDEVSVTTERVGCAVGRAVGVYPNFTWKSDPVVISVPALPNEGTSFPMGIPKVQSDGCELARQTQDLVLHPGYTRDDTIGNYMIEYDVRLTLTNPGEKKSSADVVMGRSGADAGIAYFCVVKDGVEPGNTDPYADAPIKSQWAGPKQSSKEKTLLPAPVVLEPGQAKTVCVKFLILGNSSLPFNIGVRRQAP